MVLLRPFEEKDNAALLEIEKLCPQGNDKIAEAMDKSPYSVARYGLYDNWNVYVAEEDNRVAGWTGWTLKQDSDGRKYAYLAEVIVHPDFQRKGIGTELTGKAESYLNERGASYVYCYVFEANDASNAMFSKNGYENIGNMQIQAISVYKKSQVASEFGIRSAEKEDISDIVNLINNYNSGRTHFVPFTTESFENHINNIPDYSIENIRVAFSDGRIVACTGLWDLSSLAKMYYAREPAAMRFLGRLLNFIGQFTSMPRIPAENELFDIYYLTDYAFMPEGSDAMLNLVRYLNNVVLDKQRYFIAALLTPDDPVAALVKKFKPAVENWNIYVKSPDNEISNLAPLYLDIRDFIM